MAKTEFDPPVEFGTAHIARTKDRKIFEMSKMSKTLYLSDNESFEIMPNTEELNLSGKIYPKGKFCVDYSNDYCNSQFNKWKAVIDDENLLGTDSLSIFGNPKADGNMVTIFKRVGYATSLIFLTINLLVHFLSKNVKGNPLRKVKYNFFIYFDLL